MQNSTSKNSPSYQGKFLFVNHNATNRKALPNRQAVFSHVQRNFKRWQRVKHAEDLRSQAAVCTNVTCSSPLSPSDPPSRIVDEEGNDEEIAIRAMILLSRRSPTSLMTIQKGQSDPFSAVAIRINPEENEILSFGREHLLKALWNGDSVEESPGLSQTWQEIVVQLGDEGTAFSLMSYFTTAMAVVSRSPATKKLSLYYSTQCKDRLRGRLLKADVEEYPHSIAQILRLFCCDILTRNLVGAKMHSKILRRLFEVSAQCGAIHRLLLSHALYHDTNLSAMFMTRSTFDVEDWLPKVLHTFWADCLALYPHLNDKPETNLDPSIRQYGVFTDLIDQARTLLYLWKTAQNLYTEAKIPPMATLWLLTRSNMTQCLIINYCLDITEGRPEHPRLRAVDLWPQAYVCLATLYVNHCHRFNPVLGDVVLYDWTPTIIAQLQNAIIQAERTSNPDSSRKYRNALLYSLFVAASAERAPPSKIEAADVPYAWFNRRFRAHALSMGLSGWRDVHRILVGFPYEANMKPAGKDWVDKHLQVYYDRDGRVQDAPSPSGSNLRRS